MRATVVMTLGAVLMRDRNTYSRGFAQVKRRAVAAEHFHRRPFRQQRNRLWRVRGKFLGRVNNLSTKDSEHGCDAFDLFLRHGKIIVGEGNYIA